METPAILIETLLEKSEAYGKTSYELAKLKTLEFSSQLFISLLAKLGVWLMLSVFMLVLNIGVALLLGACLGKVYLGFFVVAAFYLLLALVFHFFLKSWLTKPINELFFLQVLTKELPCNQ